MKACAGVLLVSMAVSGVSVETRPAASPARVSPPSPEQINLATQLLEATHARADARSLLDRMMVPVLGDLKRDYPASGIAEWGDRYADRQADTQYRHMLADMAQTDVRQLRSMTASIETDGGKAALAALEGGRSERSGGAVRCYG